MYHPDIAAILVYHKSGDQYEKPDVQHHPYYSPQQMRLYENPTGNTEILTRLMI
jgi:hypothetical protein